MKTQKRSRKILSMLTAVGLLLALLLPVTVRGDSTRTVKVGFFPMPGFQEYDEPGHPWGYNVDYLNILAEYAGWEYEYVRLESWDEALDALEAGSIDLVGSAQMNAERALRFGYGDYFAGSTFGALLAPVSREDIVYEDFKQFGTLKLGCVKSYVRQTEFLEYALKNGFQPDITYYENTADMREAMEAGEIDLMIASVMESSENEKVAGRFAHAPFYYITNKEDKELLGELNEAMAALKLQNPGLEDQLFVKYYPNSNVQAFTRAELDYIAENPVIKVGYPGEWAPVSYLSEDGEPAGILADLAKWMEKDTGLNFEMISMTTQEEPLEALKKRELDLVAGMSSSAANLQNKELILTDPCFSSSLLFIGKKGTAFSENLEMRIAVPAGLRAADHLLAEVYPRFEVVHPGDTKECLEAVLSGDADIMAEDYYVVNDWMEKPKYQDLSIIPGTNTGNEMCFGAGDSVDPLLISVLNKSVSHITDEVREKILLDQTFARVLEFSFGDFFYQYRTEILFGTMVLLAAAGLAAVMIANRRKYYRAIRESEHRLQSITNNINGGVITITPDRYLKIRFANDGFLELIGVKEKEQLKDRSFSTLIEKDNKLTALFDEELMKNRQVTMELQLQNAEGDFIPVLLRGTLSADEQGSPLLYCVIMDISSQKRIIRQLEAEKQRYNMLIEQSETIFFDVDIQEGNVLVSPAMYQKFGWNVVGYEGEGRLFADMLHPEDAEALALPEDMQMHRRNHVLDLRLRKADQSYLWCRITLGYFYENGTLSRIVGKIEDIDEDVKKRQQLEILSSRDKLTGLYNRDSFQARTEQLLGKEEITQGALFFLDIDNFKGVNDTLGHDAGDRALADTGDILRKVFRKDDILGRFGGDEFYVYAPMMERETAVRKAELLCRENCRSYYGGGGTKVPVSVSVGVAFYPESGKTLEKLLKSADMAAYQSKRKGKNQYSLAD